MKIAWLIIASGLVATGSLPAQSYSVDWYKIAGGGGASTGGNSQISGSIGQADAGPAIAGGNYSLTGGFWSLISMVQTAGAPVLTVTDVNHQVTVSWPAGTGGWTLQQNPSLATAGWITSSYPVNTTNGLASITITGPTGNLFFRLNHP